MGLKKPFKFWLTFFTVKVKGKLNASLEQQTYLYLYLFGLFFKRIHFRKQVVKVGSLGNYSSQGGLSSWIG